MKRLRKYMEKIILGSAVWARIMLVFLMLFMSADVVARYVINQPILGGTEFSEILMAVIVFFGMANTQAKGMNITVELIVPHLPRTLRYIVATAGAMTGLFLYGIIAWQGGISAWGAFELKENIAILVPYPFWPAKAIVPFGAGLLCIQHLMEILKMVENPKGA